MPTYHYACNVCKHEFEAEQSIKDEPLLECPLCRVCALYRLIYPSEFVLKGDCWAKDGYEKKPS